METNSVSLFAIKKSIFSRTRRENPSEMLKTIVFLTLLAACLALPVDEAPAVKSETQLVDPQEVIPPQAVAHPGEGKEEGDLKTDPTFWFSYGYPFRRRSFYSSYYSPYSYSYYGYPRYWSPYSYYW